MDKQAIQYMSNLKEQCDKKAKEESEIKGAIKQLKINKKELGIKDINKLKKKHAKKNEELDVLNTEMNELYGEVERFRLS